MATGTRRERTRKMELSEKDRRKTCEYIRNTLRQLWLRSPYHNVASNLVERKDGRRKCACCGKWFMPKEIEIDHLLELPTGKWGDIRNIPWTEWIQALFCEMDGLQGLCKDCHSKKTKEYAHHRKVQREKEKAKSVCKCKF